MAPAADTFSANQARVDAVLSAVRAINDQIAEVLDDARDVAGEADSLLGIETHNANIGPGSLIAHERPDGVDYRGDIKSQFEGLTAELRDFIDANTDRLTLLVSSFENVLDPATIGDFQRIGPYDVAHSGIPDPSLTFVKPDINPLDYIGPGQLATYRYYSDFFLFLDPLLREYISGWATGIEAVQDRILYKLRENDQLIRSEVQAEVAKIVSRRGFVIPQSMIDAAVEDVVARYDAIAEDRENEILVLLAALAQKCVQHSIDSGIRMEDINSRFQLEMAKMYFRIYDAVLQLYSVEVKTALAEYSAQVQQAVQDSKLYLAAEVATEESKLAYDNLSTENGGLVIDETVEAYSQEQENTDRSIVQEKANVDLNNQLWELWITRNKQDFEQWRVEYERDLVHSKLITKRAFTEQEQLLMFYQQQIEGLANKITESVNMVTASFDQVSARADVWIAALEAKHRYLVESVASYTGTLNAVNVASNTAATGD